jgi:hypothetical protein
VIEVFKWIQTCLCDRDNEQVSSCIDLWEHLYAGTEEARTSSRQNARTYLMNLDSKTSPRGLLCYPDDLPSSTDQCFLLAKE